MAPTATARFYGSSATVGRITFYPTRELTGFTAIGFTARDGRYFPGFAQGIVSPNSGTLQDILRDNADRFKSFGGIDHETGLSITMVAPDYARMVTPLTSLLLASGTDQEKLKTQFGLKQLGGNFTPFRMDVDPDLARYDAIAELESTDTLRQIDATRMIEANLRALALANGLLAMTSRFGPDITVRSSSSALASGEGDTCLRDAAPDTIFLNNRLLPIVQCHLASYNARFPSLAVTLSPATVEAIAHLISNYATAIGVRPDRLDLRKAYLMGIRGYLIPAVARVAFNNDAATSAAAMATTPGTAAAAVQAYRDTPGYNATGLFQPQPDFVVMAPGSRLDITSDRLTGNDLQFAGQGTGQGELRLFSTLLSVSVPAVNQANLTVVRSGDDISITVAGGFQGVTWFEYRARGEFAEERDVRVYIRAE